MENSTEAPLAANRATEQRRLLSELEKIGTETSQLLAREWRRAYPAPTEQILFELSQVVERVRADPAQAEKFTLVAKQRRFAKSKEIYTPLFGWGDAELKPGL